MVNILFAVFLGPWYGLAGAFTSSLLRNLMSLGSLKMCIRDSFRPVYTPIGGMDRCWCHYNIPCPL